MDTEDLERLGPFIDALAAAKAYQVIAERYPEGSADRWKYAMLCRGEVKKARILVDFTKVEEMPAALLAELTVCERVAEVLGRK